MSERDREPGKATPGPSLAGRLAQTIRQQLAKAAGVPSDRRYYGIALVVAATIPATIALGAEGMALIQDGRNRTLERNETERLSAYAAAKRAEDIRAWMAPMLTQPTVTALAERLGAALPADASVYSIAVDGSGMIDAKIDCLDPDILRKTLAADPLGRSLRMVSQEPAGTSGVRVSLSSRA